MLRITTESAATPRRVRLDGKIVGPWAEEFRQAMAALLKADPDSEIFLDLRGVTYADAAGRAALAELREGPVRFLASDPWGRCLAEETLGARCARRLRPASVAAILLAVYTLATPAPAQTLNLDLKQAVRIALEQNPEVQIANLDLAARQQDMQTARSQLLPQVGLSVSDLVRRSNIVAQIGRTFPNFPEHIGPFQVVQPSLGFEAPVLDLTLWRRYKASRFQADSAAAQQQTTREQYALLVVSQYLGALRAAADRDAAESRKQLAQALFDLARDLQTNGVGTGIDTLRANVKLQNETQRLIVARTDYQTAIYGLAHLLNLDPAQPIQLSGGLDFFGTGAVEPAPDAAAAIEARPEMKALAAQGLAASELEKAARGERLPSLTIDGFWGQQGTRFNNMIPVYQVAATVNVPLFTGGRIRSEVAKAQIQAQRVEKQRQELKNRINQEVRTAEAQITASRSEIETAELAVQLAQQQVEQARDRFRAGVANNIEVITAQDDLANATENRIIAHYRYNQARADLARATGRMEELYAQ